MTPEDVQKAAGGWREDERVIDYFWLTKPIKVNVKGEVYTVNAYDKSADELVISKRRIGLPISELEPVIEKK